MTTISTIPFLPNPFTPLAFLPPTLAGQAEASIYTAVAVLAAFTWDWLLSIWEEIQMCRKRKFRPAIAMYFLCRIGTLIFCVLVVLFQTVPFADCNTIIHVLEAFVILVVPSTSSLFFFRVRAFYRDNMLVVAFFGFLWLALSGLCFLTLFAAQVTHIGTTGICIITRVERYASLPLLARLAFDTLVLVAISVRIVSISIVGDTFGERMRSFFRGHGLPNLSRSLLHGGQLYYVAAISFNIVLVSMLLSPVSQVFHYVFVIPHIALDSAMACRVFRGIKLGYILDAESCAVPTTLFFDTRPLTVLPTATKVQDVESSAHNLPVDSRETIEVSSSRV